MPDRIVVLQAYHIFVIMLGGGAVVTRPNKEITSALLPELQFSICCAASATYKPGG